MADAGGIERSGGCSRMQKVDRFLAPRQQPMTVAI